MKNEDLLIKMPGIPDYGEFLDADIIELFRGRTYFSFEPLLAQLVRELKISNSRRSV